MKKQAIALSISLVLMLSAIASVNLFSLSVSQQQENNATGQQAAAPSSFTIIIPSGASIAGQVDEYYQPEVAQVAAGTFVTWSNRDSTLHTATAGNPVDGRSGQFDTGLIAPGGFGSARITGEGRIPYYCTLHPFMLGVIVVTAASSATPQAPAEEGTGNVTTNVTAGNVTAPVGNATTTTSTANDTEGAMVQPFSLQGSIASLIVPLQEGGDNATTTTSAEADKPYLASGNWSMDFQNMNATQFDASFDMVHTDGTNRHTHRISNFEPISTLRQNTSIWVTGTSDISLNENVEWSQVWVTLIVENNSTINIGINTESTDNHFRGQPLFGIVELGQDQTMMEGNNTTGAAQPLETLQQELADLGANASQAGREIVNETREAGQELLN